MSAQLRQFQLRREQILQEMGGIDRICRGHLSEQYFKSKQGGKTVRRGPYYVLQRWFQGKNLCERVNADQLEPVRQGVDGYKRFRQLADEFVDVCERITLETGGLPAVKKKRVLPPIKNGSGKPPDS
ncbi:MAG: DUF6788 family protein [Pseudomonadota bacterium]